MSDLLKVIVIWIFFFQLFVKSLQVTVPTAQIAGMGVLGCRNTWKLSILICKFKYSA